MIARNYKIIEKISYKWLTNKLTIVIVPKL